MSNSLRSSDFSPIPIYLKGTLNLSAKAKTTPPFAVPSNLVKQSPVTLTA